MDNDSHAQDNHRGSVSSSKSLEIPVTPSRSPKKVSFSDELPSSSSRSSSSASISVVQTEPSGVSQVLHQAVQYLERLHGARNYATEEAPIIEQLPPAAVLDLDNESFVQLESQHTLSTVATSPSILIAEPSDVGYGKQEVPYEPPQSNLYMERYKLNLDKNCSSMELEARREKQRWLLISECSARFGEGKHTREAFRKLFLDEVGEDYNAAAALIAKNTK
ncbi:GH19903 [Drosophila grimshawi]|uniref:GH19903 n=1 Tax=Drosophila grimshawi TaxID=7222 RepID=B4J942_DROGR|nr:GH19903 [Drosophila grimshawi]